MKLRVASVGLGWVTTHRHLPVLDRHSAVEVIGVIDRRPGLARAVAARRGYPHYHEGSLGDAAWLDELDAVVVGTSPFSRREVIGAALDSGKHVLTEKPFAMSVQEGEELAMHARSAKRVLAVVHNFQFAASTQRYLADRSTGRLGEVRAVIARQYGNPRRRLPAWYDRLPFGLFYDESPHLLYLLRLVSPGPLRLLAARVFPGTRGESTPALLDAQYASAGPSGDLPVSLTMNFEAPLSEWHLAVLGERAWADLDVFRDIYIRLPNDESHTTRTVVRTSALATAQHWWQHLSRGPRHLRGTLFYGNETVFDRFVEAALGGTQPEGISAEDALTVLRMQHEIIARAERLL